MNVWQSGWKGWRQLVFPRPCPSCGRVMFEHETFICNICLEMLPFANMEGNRDNEMFRRFSGRVNLEFAVPMLRFYKGSITRKLMHAIKYQGNQAMAKWLGQIFGYRLMEAGLLKIDHVLVPVPLHPHKLLIRGFNQSAAIAQGIADASGIALLEKALERVENHHSQTRKGREERWETIRKDFMANQHLAHNQHVILVDDVCTTGATAEVCVNALKNAGAASVGLLTLAVAGEGYS